MTRRRRRAGAALAALALLLPSHAASAQTFDHRPPVPVRSTTTACPADRVSSSATNGFRDIGGTTFEREINCLQDHGILFGRPDRTYAPASPVSRRQMALFLSRFVGRAALPEPPPAPAFTDLAGLDDATRQAIETVASHGISTGKGDGRFAPDELVTRGQMATFLDATHAALAGSRFRLVDEYFRDHLGIHGASIDAVAHAGIAAGIRPGVFAADRTVTRAQMAGFLGRLLDLEVDDRRVPWAYGTAEEASPAVFTSTGLRCTVVGTGEDDVLTGTEGPDVMCGRGGDDTVRGAGGNDVVDGGPGRDTVSAGDGADQLLGGDGEDRLDGEEGEDALRGGAGGDTLEGDAGDDKLYGEQDDDLLDGGPDVDLVDGGAGTNRCPPAAEDERLNCWWDEAPGTALSVEALPREMDVTSEDVPVTLRLHLQDDTGVERVQIFTGAGITTAGDEPAADGPGPGTLGPYFGSTAELVSGTATDGIWEADGLARRHIAPGDYDVQVIVTDVVGRHSPGTIFRDVMTVANADPDAEPPAVLSASVRPVSGSFPVDVRSGPADVVLEARITDNLSGVAQYEPMPGSGPPRVCLEYPQEGEYRPLGYCPELELVAGDVRDGLHRATVRIPQGASGGDWNVRLLVADRVAHELDWLGPDAYAPYTDGRLAADPGVRPLPGGAGRIPVQSHARSSAPYVTDLTVTPAEVDSRNGEHVVRVAVRAGDAEGDLQSVHGFLQGDGSADAPTFQRAGTGKLTGDGRDAWWYVDFVVPERTPPGPYYLQIAVRDAAGNTRSYHSPDSPHARDGNVPVLPGPATVTVTS